MKISAKTIGIVQLDYRTVLPLQGDLKTLSPDSERKLLESLRSKGKFVPEFVWLNPDDDRYYTLDGHSRLNVYAKHAVQFGESGYVIPFVQIEAADVQDAKEKLLLINSDYGKMTRQGLVDFTKGVAISSQWMNQFLDMSAFHSFDFVDAAKTMQMNLNHDLLPMPPANQPTIQPAQQGVNITNIPPESFEQKAIEREEQLRQLDQPPADRREPRVSDDDFQAITEVVPYTTKLKFNSLVNSIMQAKAMSQRHEAITYIVEKFATYEQA